MVGTSIPLKYCEIFISSLTSLSTLAFLFIQSVYISCENIKQIVDYLEGGKNQIVNTGIVKLN